MMCEFQKQVIAACAFQLIQRKVIAACAFQLIQKKVIAACAFPLIQTLMMREFRKKVIRRVLSSS